MKILNQNGKYILNCPKCNFALQAELDKGPRYDETSGNFLRQEIRRLENKIIAYETELQLCEKQRMDFQERLKHINEK